MFGSVKDIFWLIVNLSLWKLADKMFQLMSYLCCNRLTINKLGKRRRNKNLDIFLFVIKSYWQIDKNWQCYKKCGFSFYFYCLCFPPTSDFKWQNMIGQFYLRNFSSVTIRIQLTHFKCFLNKTLAYSTVMSKVVFQSDWCKQIVWQTNRKFLRRNRICFRVNFMQTKIKTLSCI